MYYQFPHIEHINNVEPYIRDDPGFIIAEKDGYTVINYVVSSPKTFPAVPEAPDPIEMWFLKNEAKKEWHAAAVRRECRGLIFCSKTGRILRRPYHKFFNVGEREEVLPTRLDLSLPHMIMDKLDGSMIAPFILNDELRWGTKMGITDVALQVEEWVGHPRNQQYRYMAQGFIRYGVTPIFEWCSPKNQIVLRHTEDRLLLTGLREMTTGRYLPIPVVSYGLWNEIELCPVFLDGNQKSVDYFLQETRQKSDIEGYIIRFIDGHMVKIKSEWYCNLHKIKEQVNSERGILDLYFSNQLDDGISILNSEEREKIWKFVDRVDASIESYVIDITREYESIRSSKISRKDFALNMARAMSPIRRSLMFTMWDDEDTRPVEIAKDRIMDRLKKSLTCNRKFEEIKTELFKDVVY